MFEGVQNHVLESLRKCKFGPLYFSSKWTKVVDSNSLKVDQSFNLTCDLTKIQEKITTLIYFSKLLFGQRSHLRSTGELLFSREMAV